MKIKSESIPSQKKIKSEYSNESENIINSSVPERVTKVSDYLLDNCQKQEEITEHKATQSESFKNNMNLECEISTPKKKIKTRYVDKSVNTNDVSISEKTAEDSDFSLNNQIEHAVRSGCGSPKLNEEIIITPVNEAENMLKCDICNASSKDENSLLAHRWNAHKMTKHNCFVYYNNQGPSSK